VLVFVHVSVLVPCSCSCPVGAWRARISWSGSRFPVVAPRLPLPAPRGPSTDTSRHQRAVEVFTATLGRPRTLYAILLIVVAWASLNLTLQHPFDPPPFFWLQGAVGLAAMLTATLILITQNRQTQEAEQRSQLDLQVNLVAEQKITKVIALIEELRRDLPTVRDRVDVKADAMTQAVDATAVLAALEETIDGPAQEGPDERATRSR
jgi:uncharacterized membrane protein